MSPSAMSRADQGRRQLLLQQGTLNGIDYVEVLPQAPPEMGGTGPCLEVFFLLGLPETAYGLTAPPYDRITVSGGVRIRHIAVQQAARSVARDERGTLLLQLDRQGDLSTYTLRIESEHLDPLFQQHNFIFRPDCKVDYDHLAGTKRESVAYPEPLIDYGAKDYAALHSALTDFIRARVPRWEDSPADLGAAMTELLAYVGDHLSYYQDAVMNEAWLPTARQRESVRRHARLIDYPMHDGCASRAFVHVQVEGAGEIPSGVQVSTAPGELEFPVVFETLTRVPVHEELNEIAIYTWANREWLLPRGTTRIDLTGNLPLQAGDYLLIQEVRSPQTGMAPDANPERRQVVRVDQVLTGLSDPLTGQSLTRIALAEADALAFDFTVSTADAAGRPQDGLAVARGNILLVEHGLAVTEEIPDIRPAAGRAFQAKLRQGPLSMQAPFSAGLPASALQHPDPRRATPRIRLTVTDPAGTQRRWLPVPDLLASDAFEESFVVETDNEGRAILRFGDDVYGKSPTAGATIEASYWIGNGAPGNVGAGALVSMGPPPDGTSWSFSIRTVFNPLPAWGGTDPEPTGQVVRLAPAAMHAVQYRAVTEADYAAAAQAVPGVAGAIATFLWTGSWYTVQVAVDPADRSSPTAALHQAVLEQVRSYQLSGYDLQVVSPTYVPLEITLEVDVTGGHLRADVEEALLEALGSLDLPDGRRGFFHPANFSFGKPVYLSQLYEAAACVPGVTSVRALTFRRQGSSTGTELQEGVIPMNRTEIARLDNDPNYPENGRLTFRMRGGL